MTGVEYKPWIVAGERSSERIHALIDLWANTNELDPDAVDQLIESAREDLLVLHQLRRILTNVTES